MEHILNRYSSISRATLLLAPFKQLGWYRICIEQVTKFPAELPNHWGLLSDPDQYFTFMYTLFYIEIWKREARIECNAYDKMKSEKDWGKFRFLVFGYISQTTE